MTFAYRRPPGTVCPTQAQRTVKEIHIKARRCSIRSPAATFQEGVPVAWRCGFHQSRATVRRRWMVGFLATQHVRGVDGTQPMIANVMR